MSDQSILGGDAVQGNADVVTAAATRLRAAEERARTVRQRLDSSGLEHVWSGDASRAFQSVVHGLPNELDKVVTSCSVAHATLDTYSSRLRDAQARADALAAEATRSAGDLSLANQRVTTAQAAVRRTRSQLAAAATPESHALFQRALASDQAALQEATRRRDSAQSGFSGVQARARANREAFEQAAETCVSGLNTASDLGMKSNLFTYAQRHAEPFALGALQVATTMGRGFVDAVEMVVDFVSGTIIDAAMIGANLAAFVLEPSGRNFDEVMDSVDAVLLIASIVVLALGAAAIAPAAAAVVGATLIAGGVRLGVDGVEVAAGRRDPDVLVWDGIGVLLSAARASRLNDIRLRLPNARPIGVRAGGDTGVRDLAFDQSESFIQDTAAGNYVDDPSSEPWLYSAPGAHVIEATRDEIVDKSHDVARQMLMPAPVQILDRVTDGSEHLLEQRKLTLDPSALEASR